MPGFYFYEPVEGHGLARDPLKAIVAPRPIGWISTLGSDDVANLAPYSYFNAFCTRPPIVGFSNEKQSDSLANVVDTGEFVVNMVPARLAQQMNVTSEPVPADIDEIALAGLERLPSRIVRPPRLADTPAALECKTLSVTRLRDLAGVPTRATLVLGQVVGVHIRDDYLKDGRFDTAAAGPLARCGYTSDYVAVRELFKMDRPES